MRVKTTRVCAIILLKVTYSNFVWELLDLLLLKRLHVKQLVNFTKLPIAEKVHVG